VYRIHAPERPGGWVYPVRRYRRPITEGPSVAALGEGNGQNPRPTDGGDHRARRRGGRREDVGWGTRAILDDPGWVFPRVATKSRWLSKSMIGKSIIGVGSMGRSATSGTTLRWPGVRQEGPANAATTPEEGPRRPMAQKPRRNPIKKQPPEGGRHRRGVTKGEGGWSKEGMVGAYN